VFSRIPRVAIISFLGSTTVFCQGTQKDVPQPLEEPPALQATENSEQRPIRVGEKIAAAQLIRQVSPVYPPLAKTAHISGTVLLHAIIGKDGTVENLQYVSGPPLLMESAMEAVRQWQYKPTLLLGEPVVAETTISVVYTLKGKNPNATESGVPGSSAEASPGPSAWATTSPRQGSFTRLRRYIQRRPKSSTLKELSCSMRLSPGTVRFGRWNT
jgi:TonB family protein